MAALREDARPGKTTYELRGGSLYLNGERMPVARGLVALAVLAHHVETGEDFRGATGAVPVEIARRALSLERARSLNSLADAMDRPPAAA